MSLYAAPAVSTPYYAINSEITGQLIHGEELERFEQGKGVYKQSEQVLFTIGYEGKSIEAFINTLIYSDVRKNLLSRKFGFSKRKLDHTMQTVGIKYVHVSGLGIRSNKRCSLETPEDYRYLFADYEKMLPDKKVFLDEVYELLQRNTRIALMCFELEPGMCHRHIVRDHIVRTHQVGISYTQGMR